MDCPDITDRLPWYLNGTLEASDRDGIRAHLDRCPDCRAELERTGAVARLFHGHVPPGLIATLAEGGSVPPADEPDVRRHLAACAACAEDLALAREAQRALQGDAPAASRPAAIARGTRPFRIAGGIAAAFLVGILAGRLAWHETAGPEAERPRPEVAAPALTVKPVPPVQANLPFVELLPADAKVRGRTPPAPVLRPDGPFAALSLVYDRPSHSDAYRLELIDAGGAVSWTAEALKRRPSGEFLVLVPTTDLRSGRYDLRLSGSSRGGAWSPLTSYALDVQRSK